MAIRSYKDRGTRDIALGVNSKAARHTLPAHLHSIAQVRMKFVRSAADLKDLKLPGLNIHALKADRAGQFAVRINDQYRICFNWREGDAFLVEIVDYH